MKIIAIDPGYERLGIAILEKVDHKSQETLLFSECFKTSSQLPHSKRLVLIGNHLKLLIEKIKPEALSIETLFFNTNQKTAMYVAEARGTIMYICANAGLSMEEFTPLQIKVAVTGYGRGDKSGISKMVPLLIKLPKKVISDDEYDAIAVGLTYFAHHRI